MSDANALVTRWDAAHYFSPAPRHRRRLILQWIRGLQFGDVLDAGCAQPYLLQDIMRQRRVPAYGCDVSAAVVEENRRRCAGAEFAVVDLSRARWAGGRQFDLVVCSEVIEHIDDWRRALGHVAAMARRHLLVTVPSGHVYPIDRHVGHVRHFDGAELNAELERGGDFRVVRSRHWGMPVHSVYKLLINRINPRAMYETFAEGEYGLGKRALAQSLYVAFFANDLFRGGGQYLMLAERVR